MCVESLLWRDGETSELEHAVCMQSECAVCGVCGVQCAACVVCSVACAMCMGVDAHDAHEDELSWQVLPASAKVLAVEEARGTAMEQAQDSAEVCVACACADAGVERKAGVCV